MLQPLCGSSPQEDSEDSEVGRRTIEELLEEPETATEDGQHHVWNLTQTHGLHATFSAPHKLSNLTFSSHEGCIT